MDLWDSSLDLFSSTNGITTALERGDASLESCMQEDSFLEEVQGRNPALLALLTSPAGLDTLLYYLTVPQHPRAPDKAFRFPHMVCQALNCKVDELLDAVVAGGGDGLLALFEPVVPALGAARTRPRRVDTSDEVGRGARDPYLAEQGCAAAAAPGGLRPYLLGYWAKVVTALCRARPAQLMRFLDATPGVAAGLAGLCGSSSVVALLGVLLAGLPWAPPAALCAPGCALSAGDGAPGGGLPAVLLRVIEGALASAEAGVDGAHDGPAAEGAAAALCAAVAGARSAAPHPKFGAPLPASTAGGPRALSAPGGAPAESAATGEDPASLPAALEAAHLQLSASFFAAAPCDGDRVPLRVLKELRDGGCAAALVGLAARAAALVGGAAAPQREAAAGGVPPTPRASAPATAALTLLAAVLDSCAESYRHVAPEGYGFSRGEGGGEGEHAAAAAPWQLGRARGPPGAAPPAPPLPPPPAVLAALCAGGEHSAAAALCGALAALCGPPPAAPLPPPSAPGAPRLGLPGVPLARAVAALTRCGWPAPAAAAAAAGAFPALLRALPAFPWHSILHRVVAAAAVDALTLAPPHVVSPLFLEARLLDRVVGGLRACGSPPAHGFSGHLHAVANAVLSAAERGALPPQVAAHVAAHGAFWALVDGELAAANVASGVLLGGKLPPDLKLTGQVGANADAMPAKGGAAGGGAAAAAVKRLAVAVDGFAPGEGPDEGGGGWAERSLSPRAGPGPGSRKGPGIGEEEEEEEEKYGERGWDQEDRGLMGGSKPARVGRGEEGTEDEEEGEGEGATEEGDKGEEEEEEREGGGEDAGFAALAEDAGAFDAWGGDTGGSASAPAAAAGGDAFSGFDAFGELGGTGAPATRVDAAPTPSDDWGAF